MYDDKGEVILPFEYDKHGKIEQGILPVSKNGKWGMIKFATDQYHGVDFDKPYHVMVDFGLDYDFIYGFTDELSWRSKMTNTALLIKRANWWLG